MVKQYLDKTGLTHLWSKIKDLIATKADTSHTQDASTITGLATVATSGSYNDLSGVPEIDKTLSEASTDDNVPSSKCVYNAIRSVGAGGGGGSSVQSDYEQNDSSQLDYIKNRTHYKEVIHQERVDLLPATEIDFSLVGEMGYTQTEPLSVQVGDTVKVLWDNQEYECVAQSIATLDPNGNSGIPADGIIFGNLYYIFEVDLDSRDIPFVVIANYTMSEQGEIISGCCIMPTSELTNPITVNIFTSGDKTVYHKLDLNYLPLSNSNISEDDNAIVTSKPLINYLNNRRPDWEINDSDDSRYIENRPFYRDLWGTSDSGLISTTITLDKNGIYTSQEQLYNFNYIWDNSYGDISLTVYWHDGTYNCKLRKIYTEWTNEYGESQSYFYFVFGNVSDIYSCDDTAPFLIYANFNPETHKAGETYVKAYDGFTGELTLQIDAEYRYWGYYTLDNKYLDIGSLQSNWNEENISAPSFIHNKPFYRYRNSGDNHSSVAGSFELNNEGTCVTPIQYLDVNKRTNNDEPTGDITINVKWNNEEYNCKIRYFNDEYTDSEGNNHINGYYVFGNVSSIDGSYSDTAPFLIYANYNPNTHEYGETYIVSQDGSTGEVSYEFRYSYEYWDYKKLGNKYLNLSTNVYQSNDNPVTGDAVYNAIQSAIGNEIQPAIDNKIRTAIGTALGGSY